MQRPLLVYYVVTHSEGDGFYYNKSTLPYLILKPSYTVWWLILHSDAFTNSAWLTLSDSLVKCGWSPIFLPNAGKSVESNSNRTSHGLKIYVKIFIVSGTNKDKWIEQSVRSGQVTKSIQYLIWQWQLSTLAPAADCSAPLLLCIQLAKLILFALFKLLLFTLNLTCKGPPPPHRAIPLYITSCNYWIQITFDESCPDWKANK